MRRCASSLAASAFAVDLESALISSSARSAHAHGKARL
jgi:hypothetical protein